MSPTVFSPPRTRTSASLRGLFLLLGLVGAVSGCSETEYVIPEPLDVGEVQWASSLGINLSDFTRMSDGTWIREDAPGTGDPSAVGDLLRVEYYGWLPDGRPFDSSIGRGPLAFRLRIDRMIPGFETGVTGLKRTGRRLILVPPDMAYGAFPPVGSPIPPNSWLVFQVTLADRTPATTP
jgi:FKBP-type peptidyl-prolyl cis-trans isomerase FkpA